MSFGFRGGWLSIFKGMGGYGGGSIIAYAFKFNEQYRNNY